MNAQPPESSLVGDKTKIDALLRELWAQTPDFACVLTDPDGIIVGWHGAAHAIFEYTEEEVSLRDNDKLIGFAKGKGKGSEFTVRLPFPGEPHHDDVRN